MNHLWFERKNNYIHLYTKNQLVERELSEIEAIEIMVTLLRANYEIVYLREKKPKLYEANRYKTLEIIKKEKYGLVISLMDQTIMMILFEKYSIRYGFDSFDEQCKSIYSFLNYHYGKGSIDYKVFSPAYLEHMLGVDIPQIEKVEYTTEKIMALALYERAGLSIPAKVRISEHSLYKQLQQGYIDDGYKSTNHFFENNAERMHNVMKEIKESAKIYPVVVYGNEDVVRDGTHRLACLYYLYGNIDVPVIRVYVAKPYYSYTMYRAAMNHIEMEVIK
ncbi:MAG: hypothetical protein HFH82_10495 [Lachnospiraceae bacterium]|nr:hypothetical protein [Lachnospiraceae bacterium]